MTDLVDGYEGCYRDGRRIYDRCVNCKREPQGDEAVCPVCFPEEARLHAIYRSLLSSAPPRVDVVVHGH